MIEPRLSSCLSSARQSSRIREFTADQQPLMSDMGHKQTLEQATEMSASPARADMHIAVQNVR